MSRVSNRVATISAALGIVLLVILLVILWSNVRNVDRIGEDVGRLRNDSTLDRIVDEAEEARKKQINDGVARIATTTLESIDQNFTNEGESLRFIPYSFIHFYSVTLKNKIPFHFKQCTTHENINAYNKIQ